MVGVIAVVGGCVVASATAAVPQVRETWAEKVTTVSASLAAQLDGGGLSTTYHFDYLSEASYQANLQMGKEGFSGATRAPAPPKAEGTVGKDSDEHVSQQVSGLQRETTYRYRVVVRNADGTVTGPERILRTKELGGPLVLLDGRGWELASPVDKNGGEIEGPGTAPSGGVFQAASGGGAVTFSSVASFGPDAAGAPATSQYVSRRGPGGWATQNVTAPLAAGGYGDEPDVAPYQLFSSELSRGLLAAPDRSPLPGTGAPPGYRNYYLRDAGGGYTALLTYADIAGLSVPPQNFELDFAGASPDLSHVVLSTCAALTGDATEVAGTGAGCDPAAPNLYERSSAGWRLLNVLPSDSVGTPPARLAASSGAISSDGSRVYWTDGADLYLSEAGAPTVRVDAGAGGGGTFQLASADGSVALFTRAGNLYRYDVNGGVTTNLTPGGGVVGVLGASADASSVYLLTAAGIVLNRGGIGTPVAAAADATNLPPSTGTARVSADGNRLAFVSASKALAEGTAHYDNETATGEPATEIYLYDAPAARLSCVSCSPTGERPQGPSTIPGAIANGTGAGATRAYKPRVLSADGNRLFFDSRDSLVPGDTNKERQDVYEWEAPGSGNCARAGGCLQLISAGSSFDSSFVDASAMGEDVFFLTVNSLVKLDPGSVDLYDAREGGGFAEPPAPFSCEEDGCQPLPPAPDDLGPGTLFPVPGNPPVHFPKSKKTSKAKKKAHHKKKHRHQRRGARR